MKSSYGKNERRFPPLFYLAAIYRQRAFSHLR